MMAKIRSVPNGRKIIINRVVKREMMREPKRLDEVIRAAVRDSYAGKNDHQLVNRFMKE